MATKPNPQDWLQLERRVRFGDTDAAGVMHFHQLLRWCHEAWEESLQRYGIHAGSVRGCRAQDIGLRSPYRLCTVRPTFSSPCMEATAYECD